MRIEELIKRLYDEKDNGGWNILQSDYKLLNEYVAAQRVGVENMPVNEWLDIQNRIDEVYNRIDGFLWGLNTAVFITDAERKELHDDLMSAIYGKNKKDIDRKPSLDKQISEAKQALSKNEKAEIGIEQESPEHE